MKVLLVSPNTLTIPYPVYPIGLDYVAGAIPARHQVQIADLNMLPFAEFEEMLVNFAPDVIGLSCRNIDNLEEGDSRYFISQFKELVAKLRSLSTAVIILGGSGFTMMPEQILKTLAADFGIIGEGERFGLVVRALEKGEDPATIPGVISPSSDADPTTPLPWDGPIIRAFNNQAEHNRFYLDRGGMLNLQSKRGCSFNCIYCAYPHIEGRRHRLIEPQEVAKTAIGLQEAGARYFFITDSAFNSDIEHSLAVAKAFKAAGLSIPWGGFFAPVKLPVDYFATMAAAGCAHVEFGTESLAEAVLKSYRKPFGVQNVLAAQREAVEACLHVAHYFLMGGPGESAATIAESLDNIEKLTRTVLFFFIGIRIYPMTALYDIALAEGKISSTTNLLEPVFYQSDDIDRDSIEDLVRARFGKRSNCVIGSGGKHGASLINRMHAHGYTGPMWERLIV